MKYVSFYTNVLPPLLRTIEWDTFNTILDLGCGDGAILYALIRLNKVTGKRLIGVDILPSRINKMKELNFPIEGYVGNGEQLNMLEDKSVDFIICHQVIEHVENEDKLIKEAHRVLSGNGYMYLSTVFKARYAWFFHKNKYHKWVLDPTHLREYCSEEQLFQYLSKYFEHSIHRKILHKFSIIDFILHRCLGIGDDIYEKNKLLNWLRKIKLPILGYYHWEFLLWGKYNAQISE